jgi:hemerythrin
MEIKWNENLAVGVEEIDSQHRELFKRINDLLSAMSTGKGKLEIEKIIMFLEDYVVFHFGSEEKTMVINGYPDIASHRKLHQEFIKDVEDMRKEFENNGPTSFFVVQVQKRVCDWLINHIGKADKSIGAFLETKINKQ